jgi:hypothetical protein
MQLCNSSVPDFAASCFWKEINIFMCTYTHIYILTYVHTYEGGWMDGLTD